MSARRGSQLTAVIVGAAPYHFLEGTAEILGILVPEIICNLADGARKIEKLLFRHIHGLLHQVFLGGPSRLLLDQIPEIIGRQMQFVGTSGYSRGTMLLRVS